MRFKWELRHIHDKYSKQFWIILILTSKLKIDDIKCINNFNKVGVTKARFFRKM